jgi:hypothetical protein
MPNRPYRPSGKSDPGALPVLVGATLGVAVVTGAIEGFVSQWFNLLLVFPGLLGAAVGGVGSVVITKRRIRNPLPAMLIAVAMGLLAQGMVHYIEYQHARSAVAESLQGDPKVAPYIAQLGIDAAVDTALGGKDHDSPAIGYIRLAAAQGITITGNGGSSGPTLTGVAAYGFWLTEFLIVAGLAGWIAHQQAATAFCEPCAAWYTTETMLAGGAGDKPTLTRVIKQIETGPLSDVKGALGKSDGDSGTVLVVRGCARCQSHEPLLELRWLRNLRKRPETKTVFSTLLTAEEADELRKGFQA